MVWADTASMQVSTKSDAKGDPVVHKQSGQAIDFQPHRLVLSHSTIVCYDDKNCAVMKLPRLNEDVE